MILTICLSAGVPLLVIGVLLKRWAVIKFAIMIEPLPNRCYKNMNCTHGLSFIKEEKSYWTMLCFITSNNHLNTNLKYFQNVYMTSGSSILYCCWWKFNRTNSKAKNLLLNFSNRKSRIKILSIAIQQLGAICIMQTNTVTVYLRLLVSFFFMQVF